MELATSRGVEQPSEDLSRVSHLGRPRLDDGPIAASVPSLKDVSLSLTTSAPHITLSPAPRLPLPQKTQRGQPRRPSTASSAEERFAILPASSPGESPTPVSTTSTGSQEGERGRPGTESPMSETSIQEMNRRAHAAVAGLRAEASKLAGAGERYKHTSIAVRLLSACSRHAAIPVRFCSERGTAGPELAGSVRCSG